LVTAGPNNLTWPNNYLPESAEYLVWSKFIPLKHQIIACALSIALQSRNYSAVGASFLAESS